MRSIYTKITAILMLGFVIQITIVAGLFKFILTKNIIDDINRNEQQRQAKLQLAIVNLQKMIKDNPSGVQEYLNQYAKDKNMNFIIKDMSGNTIYFTNNGNGDKREIQETGFIKIKDTPIYIVYAYFPTGINSLAKDIERGETKYYLLILVVSVSLFVSLLIYRILALPLKKLSKAMAEVDYGNTTTVIPYYGNDEVGYLCRNFEEMGKRLQKSEKNQLELIQAISHDLKTPLTSILGYIKRLDDGKITDENKRKEYYKTIYRKALDLKGLIEELDEYSFFNVKAKYEIQQVNAKVFMEDICHELKQEVIQKGGRLEYINNIDNKMFIMIDEAKIKRVFSNIVENSLKYAGEKCKVTIRTTAINKNLLCEIYDNGKGVEEEKLSKIFERFYRVEESRSREMGGTGLGLAICKEIIQGHGGQINAKNMQGKGLCVYFTLPIKTMEG
ncbi:hypothetical protein Q428_10575 [Fervidicella metallireducens AeB]|uniref:histidine kinase n=1 Tax=Fervidicella metallireducens AeB TaxID=1403537 RepID=A0A017RTM0_9CLOT|nr:HAMP domain-containing sensor histidine kinase [Fervidicella metallireducens]EYE87951.1 hypothetical protein Q428_10575 [Fervidicella metallireducens AeB]